MVKSGHFHKFCICVLLRFSSWRVTKTHRETRNSPQVVGEKETKLCVLIYLLCGEIYRDREIERGSGWGTGVLFVRTVGCSA